jgi:hypothetical protein
MNSFCWHLSTYQSIWFESKCYVIFCGLIILKCMKREKFFKVLILFCRMVVVELIRVVVMNNSVNRQILLWMSINFSYQIFFSIFIFIN